MHTTPLTAIFLAIPLAFAQISITQPPSNPRMIPMATPSAPAVTMAWENGVGAVGASSLNSAMQGALTSTATESGMSFLNGSVIPTSTAKQTGRTAGIATGTAMTGMNMTGAAGRTSLGIFMGAGRMVLVIAGLGLGLGVVVDVF